MSTGRRYRVLMCHNAYKEAGGESSVFETEVAGLRRAGHTVTVYSRSNLELDSMRLVDKLAVVPRAFHDRRTERDIAAIVAAERPEVAVVQNVFPLMSPSIYGALQRHGVPVVQAVFNYRFICPDAHLYSLGEICERCVGGNHLHAVVRRCVRSSVAVSGWYASFLWLHRQLGTFRDGVDRFMVPDRFLGDKLVEGGLPSEKMRVNPNPMFLDEYQPTYSHRGYVLFIGRLIEQKGVLTLIEAMRSTRDGLTLRIVGDGALAGRIRELCADPELSKRVEFLGPLWGDDVKRELGGAAAIAVPSEWYDNLPQILCQANALGKPVIASRINGIPEYVHEDENGFLFTPGDRVELAAAIDRVAALDGDAYDALARRTRAVAERDFDYAAHHRVLMSIFGELVPVEPRNAV